MMKIHVRFPLTIKKTKQFTEEIFLLLILNFPINHLTGIYIICAFN
jgi:hypothetical protein